MSENNGKFDSYLSDLKRIEGMIQILGQFDNNAYNIFHAECSEIRKNVMDLQNKIGIGIGTAECKNVIDKIADLEHKFEKYLENNPAVEKSIRAKQREIVLHYSEEVIKHIEEGKPFEKIEEALKAIVEEWGAISYKHNLVERDTIDKKFAEAMVRLQIERCRKGEKVDLSKVTGICSKNNFIFQFAEKIKLILMNPALDEKSKKDIERFLYFEKRRDKMINTPELWKVISGVSTDINLEVITAIEQNHLPVPEKIKGEQKKAKRKSLFDKVKEAAKQKRERKAAEQKMIEEQAAKQQKNEAQVAKQKSRAVEEKSLNNSSTLTDEANQKKKASEQQKENNSVVIYEFQNYNSNGEKSPQSWIVRIPKLPWIGVGSFEIYQQEVKKCFGRAVTAPDISCTRVILPEGIEVVPSDAFTPNFCKGMYYYPYKEGFQFLEVVILPESVREISASAFNGCKTLKRVEMPKGVKSIGFGAFENSGVEYITIPDGVSKIAERTFKRV